MLASGPASSCRCRPHRKHTTQQPPAVLWKRIAGRCGEGRRTLNRTSLIPYPTKSPTAKASGRFLTNGPGKEGWTGVVLGMANGSDASETAPNGKRRFSGTLTTKRSAARSGSDGNRSVPAALLVHDAPLCAVDYAFVRLLTVRRAVYSCIDSS